MGAEPDQIRDEIIEHRRRMGTRLRDVSGRMQGVTQQRISQARQIADKTVAIVGGTFVVGLAAGVFMESRRKNRQRDQLLKESVQMWPWRSPWVGYPPPMAKRQDKKKKKKNRFMLLGRK
ncbi:MAG: hypothetical protein WD533_04325 [Dehalococcoidia bacterium]